MKCNRCNLPQLGGVVGLSALHCRCFTFYAPAPDAAPLLDGARAFRPVTEEDVRRIVREMLAQAEANRPSSDNA